MSTYADKQLQLVRTARWDFFLLKDETAINSKWNYKRYGEVVCSQEDPGNVQKMRTQRFEQ